MAAPAAWAATASFFSRARATQRRVKQTKRRVEEKVHTAGVPLRAAGSVAGAPSGTVAYFTAGPGERRRMPRLLKWTLILLLIGYVPWTMVHRIPETKVLPGVPFSPTWGHVLELLFPGFDREGDADPSSSTVALVSCGTPAEAEEPWLSSVMGALGGALREDLADPENAREYGQWFFGVVKVVVGAAVDGLLGSDEPSAAVTAYETAWASMAAEATACGSQPPAPVTPVAGGASCPPSGSSAERGLSPAALAVLRCGASQFGITSFAGVGPRPTAGSDHPSGRAVDLMIPAWSSPAGKALGDTVAAWYVANGEAFDVRYVIWRDRINGLDGRGWRPYGHPSCRVAGCGSATVRHLDHVHVSVLAGPVA